MALGACRCLPRHTMHFRPSSLELNVNTAECFAGNNKPYAFLRKILDSCRQEIQNNHLSDRSEHITLHRAHRPDAFANHGGRPAPRRLPAEHGGPKGACNAALPKSLRPHPFIKKHESEKANNRLSLTRSQLTFAHPISLQVRAVRLYHATGAAAAAKEAAGVRCVASAGWFSAR